MMEHLVKFEAGYDCIRFECKHGSSDCAPGKGGSHGIHGLSIRFVSKGEKGAVQFLIYTGWLPQKVEKDKIGNMYISEWGLQHGLIPADLGYHSKVPMYEGHTMISENCDLCDGNPCYYDGSGLNAVDAMYTLVNAGDEALWKFLDQYYLSVFENGKYPQPKEYPMPFRKEK